MTLWGVWAKPDRGGSVGACDHVGVPAAVLARIRVARLQHRARLRVVDDERPEVFCRDVCREDHLVPLAAVQIPLLRVGHGQSILGSHPNHLEDHRRRVDGGDVEEERPGVFVPPATPLLDEPLVVATIEGREPATFLAVIPNGVGARPECDSPSRRVPDCDGVGEDPLHAGIRCEGLAFLHADRGKIAPYLWPECFDRLSLDDVVDLLIEGVVVRMDCVHHLASAADGLELPRSAGLGKGVDLEALCPHLHRGVRLPLAQESAQRQPIDVRRALRDKVAFWRFALISRWQDEVLAALAAVRTRPAHVYDEPEVRVVDSPRTSPRGYLDDRGPVPLQVQQADGVDGVSVSCEEEAVGVHEPIEEHDLVGLVDADAPHPYPQGLDGCERDEVQEDLHAAHAVEIVVDPLDRLLVGHAVEEAHRADRGLHLVRCHDA
mmetsp:Transcript_36166/g.72817  ORF Transcript_36166/g.72817 Transcript_36166/m.72817 type:complete len:435 (+) Transcript_36166:253-1557(+)